jgi:riboflavin kinase/FMN adenylyltransferase
MATHFLRWDEAIAGCCRGGAVAIGNFDGVHRGHQELLAEVKRQARALSAPALCAQGLSAPAVAVTFHPHPLELLRPQQFQPLLTTVACRAELMHGYGADEVVVLAATRGLLQLSASEFFERVLCAGLDPRVVVEGPNFGFGRNRQGNIDTLKALCEQAARKLVVLPPLQWEGKAVSSSRVRNELLQGKVGQAVLLLGRPFRLAGTVGRGQERGRKLGFPTANLEQVTTLVPADGVYAVRVVYQDRSYGGAANIGPNPTFGEQARKIEVHLIDFQGELHGKTLAVDFIERLRDTRAFAGVPELIEQLKADVSQARTLASST